VPCLLHVTQEIFAEQLSCSFEGNVAPGIAILAAGPAKQQEQQQE
jgi:hypothetical protein